MSEESRQTEKYTQFPVLLTAFNSNVKSRSRIDQDLQDIAVTLLYQAKFSLLD